MNYQFTKHSINKPATELWQYILNGLSKDVTIKSIEGLPYNVNFVTKEEINFSAPTRNSRKPEPIPYQDFVTVVTRLQNHKEFNTSTAKELFKGTKLYIMRSPIFALLISSGIIERSN